MAESILSNEKVCYFCGTTLNLHKHHIFYGTANRKLSERYGCWCYLCATHHNMSNSSVHHNPYIDLDLKRECQRAFEAKNGREKFVLTFGKSWI